jgi:hypothetical protein
LMDVIVQEGAEADKLMAIRAIELIAGIYRKQITLHYPVDADSIMRYLDIGRPVAPNAFTCQEVCDVLNAGEIRAFSESLWSRGK